MSSDDKTPKAEGKDAVKDLDVLTDEELSGVSAGGPLGASQNSVCVVEACGGGGGCCGETVGPSPTRVKAGPDGEGDYKSGGKIGTIGRTPGGDFGGHKILKK
ncbi:hypothetical protein A8B78_04330 [Jannaschia sp. EhC01]|nr:hypothetical protein A8B78_04330 [Jannaschia sp. EhC01]